MKTFMIYADHKLLLQQSKQGSKVHAVSDFLW